MDLPFVDTVAPAPGATWGPGDAFLGGGSWLFSEPQPGVRRLLDLRAFGWPALQVGQAGLEIAATCTFAELAAWAVPEAWPAGRLARQCCDALLGSFKIWTTATVGGNICLALPAGPMTAFAAALGGIATVWSPDGSERTVAVADFVTGARATVLAPGELLRSVLLPASSLACPAALRQLALSVHGRSAVLVIGLLLPTGEVTVTVTAATPRPVQVTVPAGAVAGDEWASILHEALDAAVPQWYSDVHGAPAWRAAMTHRLAAEIVSELTGVAA